MYNICVTCGKKLGDSHAVECNDCYQKKLIDGTLHSLTEENAALRARVEELEKPRTCAGCKFFSRHENLAFCGCKHEKAPAFFYSEFVKPEEFGCIHHEAANE